MTRIDAPIARAKKPMNQAAIRVRRLVGIQVRRLALLRRSEGHLMVDAFSRRFSVVSAVSSASRSFVVVLRLVVSFVAALRAHPVVTVLVAGDGGRRDGNRRGTCRGSGLVVVIFVCSSAGALWRRLSRRSCSRPRSRCCRCRACGGGVRRGSTHTCPGSARGPCLLPPCFRLRAIRFLGGRLCVRPNLDLRHFGVGRFAREIGPRNGEWHEEKRRKDCVLHRSIVPGDEEGTISAG